MGYVDHMIQYGPLRIYLLLSRVWVAKIGGNLQMDMSFTTIPVFGGEEKRSYKGTKLQCVVNNDRKEVNFPIYAKEETIGYISLENNQEFETEETNLID